jgi:hypothetical protein
MALPKHLYKYEGFNIRSISNLKNNQIWFSVPKDFNDPFEFKFKLKSFSEEDYRYQYERWYRNQEPKGGEKIESLKKKFDEYTKQIFEGFYENFLNNGGVCCFSEKKDDILMWSHYSDSHKGFCLEFDTNYEPFSEAKKINYSFDFPTIEPLVILPDNKRHNLSERQEELMKMIATKFKCWEYEKEWRIFHEFVNQRYGYEPQSLTGIYFGSKIESVHADILFLILHKKNPNTKFYKVIRDENHFEVNFEELPPYSNTGIKKEL